MGGSFYPPHKGHLQITNEAIKKLCLQEVWWLVARQHPDKKFINKSNFSSRVNEIKKLLILNSSKIKIITNKKFTENKSSIINLKKIIKTLKKINFVWLMGADNLHNFHSWYNWKEIFNLIPIAIFDRPNYSNISLASKVVKTFIKSRYPETFLKKLSFTRPPAWIYIHGKLNYSESKVLRKKNDN